jgi:hypothetical protein
MIKYFTVQSLWDETMAYSTVQYMENNPNSIFIIIVGDFHASFGGGLPDRLRARGINKLLTISQVDFTGLNNIERKELMTPHPSYGKRADFVWGSEQANQPQIRRNNQNNEGSYMRSILINN